MRPALIGAIARRPSAGGGASGIPTSGLIGAWNLTGGAIGQTVPAAHGTSYILDMGVTAGSSDNADPASITEGLDWSTSGNVDTIYTSTLADSDVLGAVTVVWVGQVGIGATYFGGKMASGNGLAACPLAMDISGGLIRFYRANTGFALYNGPSVTTGAYRMYTFAAPSGMENGVNFYVGSTKTAVASPAAGSGTGAPTGGGGPLLFGLRQDLGAGFVGVMSYILVYDRQLSDGEVATIYSGMQTYMATRGVTLP